MSKKMTVSIDRQIYDGIQALIGSDDIGEFLEDLARPFIDADGRVAGYVEMSADKAREIEADQWCNALAADGLDATW
jgi:hypothetical protein